MKTTKEIRQLFQQRTYRGKTGYLYRIDDSFKLFLVRWTRPDGMAAYEWLLMETNNGKIMKKAFTDRNVPDTDGNLESAMVKACAASAEHLHKMAVACSYAATNIRTDTGVSGVSST